MIPCFTQAQLANAAVAFSHRMTHLSRLVLLVTSSRTPRLSALRNICPTPTTQRFAIWRLSELRVSTSAVNWLECFHADWGLSRLNHFKGFRVHPIAVATTAIFSCKAIKGAALENIEFTALTNPEPYLHIALLPDDLPWIPVVSNPSRRRLRFSMISLERLSILVRKASNQHLPKSLIAPIHHVRRRCLRYIQIH